MIPEKIRYRCFRYRSPLGLANSAFTLWMSGKTLIHDNETCSVIAWFAEEATAEAFCKTMNDSLKS